MYTKLPVMRMMERLSGMRVCIRGHSSYLCHQRHSLKDLKVEQIRKTCPNRELDLKRKFSDSRIVMAEANPTNGFFSMGLNTLKVWNMERGEMRRPLGEGESQREVEGEG